MNDVDALVHFGADVDAACDHGAHRAEAGFHQLADGKALGLDLQTTGLDLGQVEDIVDQVLEDLGALQDLLQVVDLPLNGRNFTQMLALTPGASPVSVGQNRGGGQAVAVGAFTYPSINGQSNSSNN